MQIQKLSRTVFYVAVFSFFCLSAPSLFAKEKKEILTVEELTQTKASRLFVTRRFAEALEEFKQLERQYPKDIVIKRYMGACLDHLRRDGEAIDAFKKVLRLNAKDLPSRQYLAKIYLRLGELSKAEEEFAFIVNNDPQQTFAPAAAGQLAAIKQLREAQEKAVGVKGRQIDPQSFLESAAAKAFMNAKYEEALQGLRSLQEKYPEDLLVKRYEGITLDKLGRFDEAVTAFQGGLAIDPGNIPIHYFLAQTLAHKNDLKGAQPELEYVVQHDESRAYQGRAKADLDALKRLLEAAKPPKKWTVKASSGFDWVSNPSSKARDSFTRAGPTEEAYKFSSGAGGSYQFFRRGSWSGKATYDYSQTIYSDALRELSTFSNAWGLNTSHSRSLWGKPLTVQLGHTATHTVIGVKYYSMAFAESLTAIYSPKDWCRITLSEKWSFTNYDSNGSSPDHTSRDGFSNVAGITNNFYLNKAKTFYTVFGAEFGNDRTQGANYNKDTYSARTALHFPLPLKFEFDFSLKFKDSQYPKFHFPATTPGRRDDEYVIGATLSRSLFKHWTVNGNYSTTINNSRDINYTYTNHVVGFSFSYNY